MTPRLHRFVGRARELEELREAVRAAHAGVGRLCLITGEPGVGKSRLLEELAQAVASDTVILWGRCSEAGGAPAFWPWVQVVRALARRADAAPILARPGRAAHLAALLPELDAGDAPRPVDPERARFALLDAVIAALAEAAEATPVLVLLEDLHAADPDSIALLEVLAGAVRGARVAVAGTMREARARRSSVAAALARLAREARTLPLSRLEHGEVAEYLTSAIGGAPDPCLVEEVVRATEGNALFLAQIAPRLTRGSAIVIPHGVREAIRERLDELSSEARAALEAAAVLGREVALAELEALAEGARAAIDEALAAEIVVEVPPASVRFSHVLLVEELERSMSEDRLRDLHLRAGLALEASRGAPARIAHHFVAARERERAVTAFVRAGEDARARYAYEDAAESFARAIELSDPADERAMAELLLARAGAELLGGAIERGRESCAQASAIARRLGSTELLVRSALVRGSIFVYASVDPALVASLREALEAMPPRDAPERALVMARLAAALQPAAKPEEPIELARDAIAMARRHGEPRVLLATMRSAISAMMDLGDPGERAALNREHVRLAEQLGQPAEALRGSMRLTFDCYEIGDIAGAADAIEACRRVAEALDDPEPRWRVAALSAMRASAEGRFAESEQHEERARGLARRARDPNAERSLAFLRVGRLRLRGDLGGELEVLRELIALVEGDQLLAWIARALRAAALARAGRAAEARADLGRLDLDRLVGVGDLSILEPLVDCAIAIPDAALADRLRPQLEPNRERIASWGMLGLTVGAPVAQLLARLAAARGDHASAWALFARARERAAGMPPHLAWSAAHEAAARARAGLDEEAARCAQEAIALGDAIGIPGIRAPLEALLAPAPSPAAPATLAIRREAGVWIVEQGDVTVHVKDSKGMHMLARLVEEPGRELHVLELAGAVDGGDAGEVIDARARDAYRARVRALREEIEEATQWNDPGRRERAEAELAALEAELARALGLGGRARRAGAAVERARVNVQRRLRTAIERLADANPALGKHLARSVRTGTYCAYEP